ncbi:virion core protein, T7 gp14 family [Enterobacter roggenkampii]
MCVPVLAVAAVMAVAYAAKTASDFSDAAKNEGKRADAARLQAQQYVKQNNMNQANLNLANHDAVESAVQKMTANNMQYIQNKGALETAISESGLSGNSMNRLRRQVDQSNAIDQMNVTTEYKRNYGEIFGKQIESQQNTINAIDSLDQDAHKISNAKQVLGIGLSAVQGFVAGYSMGGMLGASAIGGGAAAAGSSATSTGANATAASVAASSMSYAPAQSTVLGGAGSQLSTSFFSYT